MECKSFISYIVCTDVMKVCKESKFDQCGIVYTFITMGISLMIKDYGNFNFFFLTGNRRILLKIRKKIPKHTGCVLKTMVTSINL
jgi:hypothetical protein